MKILYLFLYIFSFNIFPKFKYIKSSYVVGLILLFQAVINGSYRYKVLKIMRNKRVIFVFASLISVILYSFFIPTFLMTYDYSIIKTFFNIFIHLIIGIFLYAYLVHKKRSYDVSIEEYIVYIFIIQSIIQLISFFSPTVFTILNQFKDPNVVTKAINNFNGTRGLALSSSGFFGLAIPFGLSFILFFLNYENIFRNKYIVKVISLMLLIFGSVSAARVSLVGLFFGFIIVFYNIFSKNNKKLRHILIGFIKFGIIISLLLFCFSFLIENLIESSIVSDKLKYFKFFALQFIYSKKEKGTFLSGSANILFDKMYFSLPFKTLIIGDGYYLVEGSYYLQTDAGYMRNLLFFGIPGFLLLLFFQLLLFDWNKSTLAKNKLIVLYLLLLHVKGEVIGFNIPTNSILILIFLSDYFKNRQIKEYNSTR